MSKWCLSVWVLIFKRAGFPEDIAREEYQVWAEGLDGELDNEFLQTEYSVICAAKEAISELSCSS